MYEERGEISKPGPLAHIFLGDIQILTAQQRDEHQQHKDTQEWRHHVPTKLVEHQQQHTATYQGTAKAAHRLHAVHHTLVAACMHQDGEGIGSNVLSGRGHQRQHHHEDDQIKVISHIEVTGKDDEYGIDNLADDNATAEVAPRQTMTVNQG